MLAMNRWLCILSTFGLVLGGRIDAQTAPEANGRSLGPRVPVTIVLSDELPDAQAEYVIQRVPGRAHPDLILLRPSANEEVFSAAIRALLLVRRHGGDAPSSDGMLRARPSADQPGHVAVLPWAARVLADLHAAEPMPIEGIGTFKATTLWLPRQDRVNPPR